MPKPYRYLFDTPQGRAKLHAFDKQLHDRLATYRDPVSQAAAWEEHYRESVIETGLESENGRGDRATYNFKDAALYGLWAADTLAGHSPAIPVRKRPQDALEYLAKGYGRRFRRAEQGLRDALIQDPSKADMLERFNFECEKFMHAFTRQLDAAFTVNERRPYPAAVADAIRIYLDGLQMACKWLDIVGKESHAELVRMSVDAAALTLREVK